MKISRHWLHSIRFVLICLVCTHCASTRNSNENIEAGHLTISRIFDDPNLDGPTPRLLKVSPDGTRVTFLKEKKSDAQKLDLWEFNLQSRESRVLVDSSDFLQGEENLSTEEKARRERMRISNSGIVEYSWSSSGNSLVFPLAGGLFYFPLQSERTSAQRLTDGKHHETDAHISTQGRFVSFVRNSNLYLVETASKREHQVTRDGSAVVKNGIAEFIAQEEMNRFDGQWWSEDERYLAFTRTDESPVDVAKRYEINGDGFEVYSQRYPATGTKNARIKLGIAKTSLPSEVQWLDLSTLYGDIYLARANWLPDSRTIALQVESRDQKTLTLLFYNVETRKTRLVLTEKDPYWVNLNHNLRFLKKSKAFIWGSERTGFEHLYLYGLDGTLIRPLTQGSWPIQELLAIDSNERYAYFSASRETPIEKHLYRVALSDGVIERISREFGWHQVSLSENAHLYVDSFSNENHPARVSVHAIDGTLLTELEPNRLDSSHPLSPYLTHFSKPEYGSFRTKDGTELHFQLLKPKNYDSSHRYPVIVDVYGGPGHQNVQRAWGKKRFYWHQVLAERGYVVFTLDNRGSSNRGHSFETAIYHQLGQVEVQDQKEGVDYLVSNGIADPKRIGVFGWSYGGYMALMTLLREPSIFKVAVSVAPVTDWTLYDTHYTERFLGTPTENPEGYKKSSVLEYVSNLRGKLLMIHGMADDNVLFTNSTKIYKALQDRALPFDMMAYPGSKHGIYGKKPQTHVFSLATRYFDQNL